VLLSFLLLGAFAQIPTDACSLCTVVVDGLEAYVVNHVKSKENLMQGLTKLQNEVCPKLPASNAYFTAQQCSDYVRLYGPYVVDLMVANSDPSKICSTLGLCEDPAGLNQYSIVFPTITDSEVEYDVPLTKIENRGQQFFYKVFLAHPSFAEDEFLSVQMQRTDIEACGIAMEITNKTRYLQTVMCDSNTTACRCVDNIPFPGRGVWYYITVTSIRIYDGSKQCSFSLKATVQNMSHGHYRVFHVNIFTIILPILCCLCCCCCCVRRRYSRGYACRFGKCKRNVVQQTEQSSVAVDMQEMPSSVDQNATPMGYYYVPTSFAGSYIPVPQNAQPVAYPQFIPVQQQE